MNPSVECKRQIKATIWDHLLLQVSSVFFKECTLKIYWKWEGHMAKCITRNIMQTGYIYVQENTFVIHLLGTQGFQKCDLQNSMMWFLFSF